MERTHSFRVTTSNVKDQEYSMEIPTAGQLIAIERAKANLTGGDYGAILNNRTIGSEHALDVVDMAAYLSTLCPKLFTDLKVDSLMDLDMMDMKQLQAIWTEQCIPWINDWQRVLREKPKTSQENSSDDKTEEQ